MQNLQEWQEHNISNINASRASPFLVTSIEHGSFGIEVRQVDAVQLV